MTFNIYSTLDSFGQTAVKVKEWAIGRMFAEAGQATVFSLQHGTEPQITPGVYALLAGISTDIRTH